MIWYVMAQHDRTPCNIALCGGLCPESRGWNTYNMTSYAYGVMQHNTVRNHALQCNVTWYAHMVEYCVLRSTIIYYVRIPHRRL